MENFENLSRGELIKLLKVYAKNWLAHDGCWFLAAEEKFDIETAIELDTKSWERFAVSEAKRIINEFNISSEKGLEALKEAFKYRMYAAINKQESEIRNGKLVFKMVECRVQKTRRQKGLPDFPCKSVGIVEFSNFAKTVNPKIKTKCISCPPDKVEDFYCGWEFSID